MASGVDLGRTLRERRRGLGLARTRLADRVGLSASDIARWERGEALPNPSQLTLLAEAVGFDEDETREFLEIVVDITGPEVDVQLVDGGDPAPNPFSTGTRVKRSDQTSAIDRLRSRLNRLRDDSPPPAPEDPTTEEPPAVRPLTEPAPPRPAPSARTALPRAPHRPAPGILPGVRGRGSDPAARVFSQIPAAQGFAEQRALYRTRYIVTTAIMFGFGILLWWAFGELAEGIGDFFDLFRTAPEPTVTQLP